MPQKLEAPFGSAAFDLEHLMYFERLQARMRQIERNGDGRDAFGRKPFVAQIAFRTKAEPARFEFGVELRDARFQFAARDRDAQIADAPLEQLIVFKRDPGWFCRNRRSVLTLHRS